MIHQHLCFLFDAIFAHWSGTIQLQVVDYKLLRSGKYRDLWPGFLKNLGKYFSLQHKTCGRILHSVQAAVDIKYMFKYSLPLTFFQHSECLTIRKNAFHVNPDGTFGGIFAPDNSEAKTLLPRSLLESDIFDAVGLTFSLSRQCAELGAW